MTDLSRFATFVFNTLNTHPMTVERLTMNILIPSERIQERVVRLAEQIGQDYQDTPVTIIGVLNGCLIFMADLIRHLRMPLRLGFLRASSYRGTATEPAQLRIYPELMPDVQGRHVLLLDDILDTGQTLNALIQHVRAAGAATLRTGVLLRKEGRLRLPVAADYWAFDIPDKFVVGYGLDFNDEYRNLPYIAELPEGPC
jgi:hypoxanthine phosphoribosyltransferase